MGCAGDARQASVPAATSDSHTQERLPRHTRGAPHASRRWRWAGGAGPHTPSLPRTSAVRNGFQTISLSPSRTARHRAPVGPRGTSGHPGPRFPSSSFGRPSRRAAADPPAPSRERVRVGPSAPFQRTLWGLDPSPASPVTLTHDQRGTGVQARGHSSVRAANRGTRDLAPRACLFGAPQTPHSIPIRDLPSGSCPNPATRPGSAASLTGPDPQAPATRPAPGRSSAGA